MLEATNMQIKEFKNRYCGNNENRQKINDEFNVEVESYEELLPGKTVRSYATGNRRIDRGFIVFKVQDIVNGINYHPVFSESLGRQLVKDWKLKLPKKMKVFSEINQCNDGSSTNLRADRKTIQRKDENKQMLLLIQLARSMMILHVEEPEPMRNPFKDIYHKLEQHPRYDVFESDIKSINTAISHFFCKAINKNNENFTNLQEYVFYLEKKYPDKRLRNFDFERLRDKIRKKYPNENIVF